MKKGLIDLLKCPNSGRSAFLVFGAKVLRKGTEISSVDEMEIQPDDEIFEGLLVSDDFQFAFPISHGVLVMLSDEDVDISMHNQLFESFKEALPKRWIECFEETLKRIDRLHATEDGKWNREEMKYYDNEVDTSEKRERMANDITTKQLPHIFIPREKYFLRKVRSSIKDKCVVEIGCGNARTMTMLLPCNEHNYRYIGTDISFWRLVAAKLANPAGEFIQSSALNLAIRDQSVDIGISFGMLHHLPRPIDGLTELHRTLKPNSTVMFHEPIETKKIVTGHNEKLESALNTYEHSERDGEIDLGEFESKLSEFGLRVNNKNLMVSPFRSVIEVIVQKVSPSILRNRKFLISLMFADAVFLKTVGRFSKYLAPRAVVVVATRNK